MNSRRGLTLLVLVASAQISLAVPKVLLVNLKAEMSEGEAYQPLPTYLASELNDLGKVDTIVWSQTDADFRDARANGRINSIADYPTLKEAQDGARSLGCDYLLAMSAISGKEGVKASGTLYHNGRKVWSDLKQMSVSLSTVIDIDSTLLSISRTWGLMLHGGPFKDLPEKPINNTPELSPGQIPAVTTPPPNSPQAQAEDNQKLFEEVERLRKAGQVLQALLALRDGVDRSPFDPERRKALIEAYQALNRPELAAIEARRAAALIPTSSELRAMAGAAWMNAGDKDQARIDLMAVIAKSPDDKLARSALADMALEDGKAEEAIEHLSVLQRVAPSQGVFYRVALAHSMQGDVEGVQNALNSVKGATAQSGGLEPIYLLSASSLDTSLNLVGGQARSLFQRAIVDRKEPEVAQELELQMDATAARLLLLQAWSPPPRYAVSHERRILALKLLAQSLTGLKAYVASGDEDALTDARIDLGEALKHLSTARESYQDERDGGAKHDRPSGP
jgi:tetratricopeptide (TPR) repeat protein